jgi:hypothetical protein
MHRCKCLQRLGPILRKPTWSALPQTREPAGNLRMETGEQEAACKTVNTSWLTVTNAMQTYSARAYVRLNPATRK